MGELRGWFEAAKATGRVQESDEVAALGKALAASYKATGGHEAKAPADYRDASVRITAGQEQQMRSYQEQAKAKEEPDARYGPSIGELRQWHRLADTPEHKEMILKLGEALTASYRAGGGAEKKAPMSYRDPGVVSIPQEQVITLKAVLDKASGVIGQVLDSRKAEQNSL